MLIVGHCWSNEVGVRRVPSGHLTRRDHNSGTMQEAGGTTSIQGLAEVVVVGALGGEGDHLTTAGEAGGCRDAALRLTCQDEHQGPVHLNVNF